ncbi:caspase-like [Euwallacea fornicatus]|uniref:caspase-like n=1 Tax=Euwallacea fornicatus TaxID=995702 RepID=UPI00338E92F6
MEESEASSEGTSHRSSGRPPAPRTPVGQHPDDEFYDMGHKNRGIALIFNHTHFDSIMYKERKGTEHDSAALRALLRKLSFHVEVYEDYTLKEIRNSLRVVSRMNHSENDCLVIAVLSHGRTSGRIAARDNDYTIDEMIKVFNGHYCPSLVGKPKLFFIQACRGDNLDSGVHVQCDSSEESIVYKIPAMADILIMYATVEGYAAWRDQTKGSWFIQTLVRKLEEHHNQRDLMSILTMVNREIAVDFESHHFKDEYNGKKEMCSIVSMLTRGLFFR